MVLIYTLAGLAAVFAVAVLYTGIRMILDPAYYERSRKEVEERDKKKAEAARRRADYRVRMYKKTGDVRYINDPYFRSPDEDPAIYLARRNGFAP